MRLHKFNLWNDVCRSTTGDSYTPWIWHLIRGPWRSSVPSRSTTLTPGLNAGGQPHSCRLKAGVGKRLSRSTATVGTAESLASISGAGLAATEGWRLAAGIGTGALQRLAMWPGCWHRWQRTRPLLRRLLGHLHFFCSSYRRSRRFRISASFS